MNSIQFKKLIKESVREVIKEELSDILKEAILNNSKVKQELNEGTSFSFTSNDVILKQTNNASLRAKMNEIYGIGTPPPSKHIEEVVEAVGGAKNPFAGILAQTAVEMSPQDRANLRQLD